MILNESSEVATVYATETAFRYLNHYSEKYLKGSELSKDVKIAMYKKYNLNTKLVADKKIKKFSKLILNGFIGYDAKEFGCSIVGVKSPIYPNPNNLTQWTGENFLDLNIQFRITKSININDYLASAPDFTDYDNKLKELHYQTLTPYHIEVVKKWAGGPGTSTPSGLWLDILFREIAEAKPDLEEEIFQISAFAEAMYNTFLVVWHNKKTYLTERPFQHAARIGLIGFTTVIPTPPFPAYISGHSTVSQVAGSFLSTWYPLKSQEFRDMVEEASNSRILGKIHYRQDCVKGMSIGKELFKVLVKKIKR